MLKLYHAAHSTCSQKVRLVLSEKNIEWEDHLINLATNEHLRPEYLAINPNGVVPTLVHDSAVVTDSSVICEYLEEMFPDPALSPPTAAGRAHMRAIMRFLEEVPTPAVRPPSFNMAFLPRFDGLDDDSFRKQQSDIRPIRKHFYREMGKGGFDEDAIRAALDRFDTSLSRMERHLGSTDGWLAGAAYTIADAVALPLVDRMYDLKLAGWEGSYPLVSGWYERATSRPSFPQAFPTGSRLSEFLEIRPLQVEPEWGKHAHSL